MVDQFAATETHLDVLTPQMGYVPPGLLLGNGLDAGIRKPIHPPVHVCQNLAQKSVHSKIKLNEDQLSGTTQLAQNDEPLSECHSNCRYNNEACFPGQWLKYERLLVLICV